MRNPDLSKAAMLAQSRERRPSILDQARAWRLQASAIGGNRTVAALAATVLLLAPVGARAGVLCGPNYGTACFPLKTYMNGGAVVTGNLDLGAATVVGDATVSGNLHFTGTPLFDNLTLSTLQNTPIGTVTPNVGKFTTLSASSTVSGTGFTNYLASPPNIGSVSPAAGSFTTLSATGTVAGAGITALFASPPAIGGTSASSGKFTTIQASGVITPDQVAGIAGTTTNNSAQAGSVGEIKTLAVPIGSAVTLGGTGVTANVGSVLLSAGDWDCTGYVDFYTSGATVTSVVAGINGTSATLPTRGGAGGPVQIASSVASGGTQDVGIPPGQRLLSGSANIFLVAQATYSGTAPTVGGYMQCRRVR